MRQALEDLIEAVEAAINAGDWKVDGACDPTLVLIMAKKALAQPEQEPVSWESILGAVARGWCYEENANKTMDSELAVAIAKEVQCLYTTPPQPVVNQSLTTEQEPVAWLYESPMPDGSVFVGASAERLTIGVGVTPDTKERPLYTTPPQRQQFTITEESAWDLALYVYLKSNPYKSPQIILSAKEIKQIIEAAHGIKETWGEA